MPIEYLYGPDLLLGAENKTAHKSDSVSFTYSQGDRHLCKDEIMLNLLSGT